MKTVWRCAGAGAGTGSGDAAENKMQREGLLKDVEPMVDAKYRVYADRDDRAIAGISLGAALAPGITPSSCSAASRHSVPRWAQRQIRLQAHLSKLAERA